MEKKRFLLLGIIFSFILTGAYPVFSQEQAVEPPAPQEQKAPAQPPVVKEAAPESEALWIWGDVISVDKAAKKMVVKYLDYETDTDKEINITADDKTSYENIKSFDEIKPQDTVSIDYAVGADGSNMARNISVEKPEGTENAPEGETAVQEEPKAAPESE